jgi:hypothetical protein
MYFVTLHRSGFRDMQSSLKVHSKDFVKKALRATNLSNVGAERKLKFVYRGLTKRYPEVEIFALKEFKCLFFPIPKAANTSLKTAFGSLIGIDVEGSLSAGISPFITKNRVIDFDDFWKFTFVRNPWDRLVSCYSDKIKKDSCYNNNRYINGVYVGLAEYGYFRAGMPFEEFACRVCDIPDLFADRHFVSQHILLTNKSGELMVDFVGRFENLEGDFKQVLSKIGHPNVSLPHARRTIRKPFFEYYTPQLWHMVGERYAKDIEMFDYELCGRRAGLSQS